MFEVQPEVHDPVGLLAWYCRRFYPGADDESFDWSRLYGLLTAWQNTFNRLSGHRCRGLRFMRLERPGRQYCYRPFCPTCWHRRQADILTALRLCRPWPYQWLRETWWVRWDDELHPDVIRRFKARKSRSYRLLAYTLNVEAQAPVLTYEEQRADLEFHGELSYQLMGIFLSCSQPRDPDTIQELGPDQSHLYQGDELVGIVNRRSVTDLVQAWLDSLKHPWEYRGHGIFERYVKRFDGKWPTGRSWAYVSKARTFYEKENPLTTD